DLIRRTRLIHRLLVPLGWMFAKAARVPFRLPAIQGRRFQMPRIQKRSRVGDIAWAALVLAGTVYVVYRVFIYVRTGVSLDEVGH
ncbi:sulfonate ABC transporter permease, partial [Burkholderia sp. SIMBA_057]